MTPLSKTDFLLAARLLRAYSERLGNDGCNDFALDDEGVPPEEWERIDRECAETNNSPSEHVPGQKPEAYRTSQPNFAVVDMLAKKMAKAHADGSDVAALKADNAALLERVGKAKKSLPRLAPGALPPPFHAAMDEVLAALTMNADHPGAALLEEVRTLREREASIAATLEYDGPAEGLPEAVKRHADAVVAAVRKARNDALDEAAACVGPHDVAEVQRRILGLKFKT